MIMEKKGILQKAEKVFSSKRLPPEDGSAREIPKSHINPILLNKSIKGFRHGRCYLNVTLHELLGAVYKESFHSIMRRSGEFIGRRVYLNAGIMGIIYGRILLQDMRTNAYLIFDEKARKAIWSNFAAESSCVYVFGTLSDVVFEGKILFCREVITHGSIFP